MIAIFKSYPTFGDHGLWYVFLLMYSETFKCTNYNNVVFEYFFITFSVFVFSFLLIPIMYVSWINMRSANANFFYALNLCFAAASMFLLQDLVTGMLKRFYNLKQDKKENIHAQRSTVALYCQ